MIRFFRSIRQKLAAQNKAAAYMRYAIGEILLVAIGILIALQVNNWNENRKSEARLNASLSSLIDNLNEDVVNMNAQVKYNQKVLKAIDFAFRVISLPEFEKAPSNSFADSIFAIGDEREFMPTETIFNSMESNSQVQWITDQSLTEDIYGYYGFMKLLHAVSITNNNFVQNYMEKFTHNEMELGSFLPNVNPYSDKRKSKWNNTEILRESVVFENNLISRKIRANGEITRFEIGIMRAKQLKQSIEDYLKVN
jgi:hypothetical protein